jgi:hypothetical protein
MSRFDWWGFLVASVGAILLSIIGEWRIPHQNLTLLDEESRLIYKVEGLQILCTTFHY